MKKTTLWPAIYAFLYLLLIGFLGGLAIKHFVLMAVFVIPYYLGGRYYQFARLIFPFILTLQVYDSMGYYNDLIRAEIHVDDIYHLEKDWFGIDTNNGRVTLNEYLQTRTHWFLDAITGVTYLIFAVLYLLQGIFYRFFWAKTDRDARRAEGYMWGFFFVNLLGYSTYYWFPAAPPWYVADYGLGPANLAAQASPGGAIRFDELFGVTIFANMYGAANTVFGAIPSLHCAYPALAMFFSFAFKSLRIFSTLFCILMFFSAIYLNHHYLIDGLWGAAYSLLVFAGVSLYIRRRTINR